MNSKTILGISLVAAFAVSMIMTQTVFAGPPPSYMTSLQDVNVDEVGNGNKNVYEWILGEGDKFPRVPDDFTGSDLSEGVVGIGVAAVTGFPTGDFTGATIHPQARDNRQNPDGWHPHDGTVVNGCITELQSPHAGISIVNESFRMSMNQRDASVDSGNAAAGAAFILVIDGNCPPITGIELPDDGWGNENNRPKNIVGPDLPGLRVVPTIAIPVNP